MAGKPHSWHCVDFALLRVDEPSIDACLVVLGELARLCAVRGEVGHLLLLQPLGDLEPRAIRRASRQRACHRAQGRGARRTREGAEVGTEASRSRFLSTWIECIFTARVYGETPRAGRKTRPWPCDSGSQAVFALCALLFSFEWALPSWRHMTILQYLVR